jgi:long-chain fatty acid transport protein
MPDFSFDPGVPSAEANIVGGGMGFLCRSGGKILGLVPCGEVGVGRIRTQGIGLDLSYQASLYDARTIAGNRNPTVNGTYRTTLHTGGLSLRLLF